MVMSDKWRMPIGLRRASAVIAIAALAVGGAKVLGDHTEPGSGFSTVATVGADPTGPTGPGGGGMTGPPGGGSQFQPPSMPSQLDYQGANQPPLDQNGGVNIYNTPAQGAPQQPGQANGPQQGLQPGQNADGTWQRAANGEQQPIDHGPAEYTQGPGEPNPDYQAPQQGSPQQGQQSPQEGQQPSEAPTQTQQPQTSKPSATQEPEPSDGNQDTDRMLDCVMSASSSAFVPSRFDGVTRSGIQLTGFQRDIPSADGTCRKCDPERIKQFDRNCDTSFYPGQSVSRDKVFMMPCGYIYDPDSKVTDPNKKSLHDYCTKSEDDPTGADFAYSCARHDMCYEHEDNNFHDSTYHACNVAFQNDLFEACDVAFPVEKWSPSTWGNGPDQAICKGFAKSYYLVVEFAHK
ncbi:phospholipase A2 [Mycobacteroides chelonae]|uniref:phospholipase A2 n=1 Tax=Mycobacteroides chelonae TaxID=1774 RepID=UPI0009C08C59|nr:phospholipase A2 [Mycobacteroides chelonae]